MEKKTLTCLKRAASGLNSGVSQNSKNSDAKRFRKPEGRGVTQNLWITNEHQLNSPIVHHKWTQQKQEQEQQQFPTFHASFTSAAV